MSTSNMLQLEPCTTVHSLHMGTELNITSSYLSSKRSTLKADSSAPVLSVFAQTKGIAPNSQPSVQILTEHCGKDHTG